MMNIPVSTYRVQLNKDFTFRDLDAIVDYLDQLGITMIYSAPMFKATPGSNHGYDVTDPHTINPEIGTLDEFRKLSERLRQKNILWLQDIVPNHMAFNQDNSRLMDVLERGDGSEYYSYFDIDWEHPDPSLFKKVMVPTLGRSLEEAISEREISLAFHDSGISVRYFDKFYPLSVSAYGELIYHSFPKTIEELVYDSRSTIVEWQEAKAKWYKALVNDSDEFDRAKRVLDEISSDESKLTGVLEHLHYRLTWWKKTEEVINYRRFFTINDLICLRMEDPWVFKEYHKLLLDLYQNGYIHGLRIDHIDGLHDPTGYVRALREHFGEECYIIAEKILESEEDMPPYWPLQGASGYQFLSYVSNVFTDRKGADTLLKFYHKLVPDYSDYGSLVLNNKRMMVERYMAGERDNLVGLLQTLHLHASFSDASLREALTILMISLPVYRIYPRQIPVQSTNLTVLKETFENARSHNLQVEVLNHLEALFTSDSKDTSQSQRALYFLRRLMQFTGPVTAKGVEDTTFYMYNPLISHDEVGDSPDTLGISIKQFHDRMRSRQNRVPLSLNATATHDTKRGEDARIRLNVLSEMAEEWTSRVSAWIQMNDSYKATRDGKMAPVVNDEYFIYQSMIGGFPQDLEASPEWQQRLTDYVIKALREAKVHSNWEEPDEFYEQGSVNFIKEILRAGNPFLKDFKEFMSRLLPMAHNYSLAQPLLKITAPGIPDTYQGCELWDHSFVDPDNRRPVDYDLRKKLLNELGNKEKDRDSLFEFLQEQKITGIQKLYVTWRTLTLCRDFPDVFTTGEYVPLETRGKPPILAFARRRDQHWIIVVVKMNGDGNDGPEVILPNDAPRQMYNHMTNEVVEMNAESLGNRLFNHFPVALLSNLL